jgi:hypothetical protein
MTNSNLAQRAAAESQYSSVGSLAAAIAVTAVALLLLGQSAASQRGAEAVSAAVDQGPSFEASAAAE